ncbi:MAG: tetratricopeptide repeat protein [Planctomycetota bacterium]|nr:MAG: tetratricopeptide repeat protein [Planctomycetota bacterium]
MLHLLLAAVLVSAGTLPPLPQAQPQENSAAVEEANRTAEAAAALLGQGKAAEAVVLLRAALEQERKQLGAEDPLVVRTMNNLAYALSQNREFEEALRVGHAALEVVRKSGDPSPGTAMVRRNLGEIAERAGRLDEARALTEAAVRDFEATYGRTPMAAEARMKAAQLAALQGDLAAAQQHLEWAVAIDEQVLGPVNPETAGAVRALGGVLAARGRLDPALLLLEHALNLLEAAGAAGSPAWVEALVQHMEWLSALGDFEAAKEDLDRWVAALEAEAAADAGASLLNLEWARRYLDLGFPAEAQERLDAQLAVRTAAELEPLQRGALSDLRSRADSMLGRHAQAEAEASAALGELEPALGGRGNEVIVNLLLRRGLSRLALGRQDEAVADLREALELRRAGLGPDHPNLLENFLGFLGAELRRDKVTREVIDLVDMAEAPLAHASPASLALRRNGGFARELRADDAPLLLGWLRLAATRKGQLPAAFAALERQRQRALLSALAWWIEGGAASAEPALRAYLAELHRVEATLGPSEAREDQLAALRQSLCDSGSRWASLVATEGATLDAARGLLAADGQALLLYSWAGEEAYGLVLRRDAARDRLVSLGRTSELEPKLQAAQAALRDLTRPCDLTALSAALVAPLWEALNGCTEVTVIADGPLAFLPFEALSVPQGGLWVRSCRISYAPSVHALLQRPQDAAAGSGALHVGPPDEHPEDVPAHQIARWRARWSVTHATGPAPAIGELLPEGERLLAGAAATESAWKEMDATGALGEFRLLDLRAPVFVDAAMPSATGILLSPEAADDGEAAWKRENGVLDLAELSGLHLGSALVLLPRAETGPQPDAGGLRSEGLHALVWALWTSGARGVIVSGWTLSGVPALNFDRLLLQQVRNAGPGAALWNAQKEWLERAEDNTELNLAHPGLWARHRYFGR